MNTKKLRQLESDSEEDIDQDQFEDEKYISEEEGHSDIIDKDNGESESVENIQNWGDQKHNYYYNDNETSGESDQEEAEHKEAQNIHKIQQSKLRDDDFDLPEQDDLENKILDEDDEADQEILKNQNKEILEEEKEIIRKNDLEEIQMLVKEALSSVESIQESDVFLENPEVLNKQKVFSKNFPNISKDMNMCYLISIYYYFILKKSGQSVKTHPVIKYLTQIKDQISKITEVNKDFQVVMNETIKGMALKQQEKKVKKSKKTQQNNLQQNLKIIGNGSNIKNSKLAKLQKGQKSNQQQNKNHKKDAIQMLSESDEEEQRIRGGVSKKISQKDFNTNLTQEDFMGSSDDQNDWAGDEDSDDIDLDNINLNDKNIVNVNLDNEEEKQNKKQKFEQEAAHLLQQSKKVQKGKNKKLGKQLEDKYYEMIKTKQIEKQLEKDQAKQQKKAEEEAKLVQYSLKEVKPDQPRRINMTILQNKGIVRSRNHDISKVKLRKKFKKAENILVSKGNKSRKRVTKDVVYAGETQFIKPGVIRGSKQV